jgi:hypothetical protein
MPTTAEDDDDDGPFVSKMKGAILHPPRPQRQYAHTLGTKDEGNNNLKNNLLDFVPCVCHFCVSGL